MKQNHDSLYYLFIYTRTFAEFELWLILPGDIKLNGVFGFVQELSLFALKLRNSVKLHFRLSDSRLIFILKFEMITMADSAYQLYLQLSTQRG